MATSFLSYRFLLLVLSIVCLLSFSTSQQDCASTISGLTGCASYLTNPSTKPDQTTCCAPLKTVLADKASIQCICALQNSSAAQSINFKNALTLPQACSLPVVVSEANCTSSSSTTPSSSSGKTPASTATTNSNNSAGCPSFSPFSSALLLAFIFAVTSSLS